MCGECGQQIAARAWGGAFKRGSERGRGSEMQIIKQQVSVVAARRRVQKRVVLFMGGGL